MNFSVQQVQRLELISRNIHLLHFTISISIEISSPQFSFRKALDNRTIFL